MTVIKSKRDKSKLEVLTKARELAVYTIKICSNEKSFPKRYRWCITSNIVAGASSIYRNIRKANKIYVKTDSDYELRRHYQTMALAEIDALYGDIDIAYEIFKVDGKRIDFWTGLTLEVENLTREWRKSDAERYAHLI